MQKHRKIRSDYREGMLMLYVILRARPDATNRQLMQWTERSRAFIDHNAGAVRERLGIEVVPGRHRNGPAPPTVAYCPHNRGWVALGAKPCCTPRFDDAP